MLSFSPDLELDNWHYCTVFDGDKPVATIVRRHTYEYDRPPFTVFALTGVAMFGTWKRGTIERRLSALLAKGATNEIRL